MCGVKRKICLLILKYEKSKWYCKAKPTFIANIPVFRFYYTSLSPWPCYCSHSFSIHLPLLVPVSFAFIINILNKFRRDLTVWKLLAWVSDRYRTDPNTSGNHCRILLKQDHEKRSSKCPFVPHEFLTIFWLTQAFISDTVRIRIRLKILWIRHLVSKVCFGKVFHVVRFFRIFITFLFCFYR